MTALAHMEALYARNDDPWGVAERWYERRKIALVLACLPAERYASGFDSACGTGHLTRALAGRCTHLLAADGAPSAVRLAQRELADVPHVRVQRQRLPQEWPARPQAHEAPFDLIVLSEWLYYLEPAQVRQAAGRCIASLAPGGTVLACHYRRPFADRACATGFAHACLAEALGRQPPQVHHEEDAFLIDAWVAPTPPRTAANASGGPA